MNTRRWFAEPLLAALLTLLFYLAWQILYARVVLDVLWVVVPVAAWTGLVIVGNRFVRERGFTARSLVAFLAAAALCVPFAIYLAVVLTANDGWRGLGAISAAVPLIAPFVFLLPYWAASALLLLVDDKREIATSASHP